MKPVVTLGAFAAAVALVAAIACGSDTVASPTNAVNTAGGVGGAGHDSAGSPGGSTGDSSTHGGPGGGQRHPWLTVTPEAASVQIGHDLELHATLHDTTGAPISARVMWRSSDARIATVSDSGLVHGVAAGVAAIFASANGYNDSAEVAVVDSVVPPSSPPPPPPPTDSGTVRDSTPPAPPPPDTTPPRDTSTSR